MTNAKNKKSSAAAPQTPKTSTQAVSTAPAPTRGRPRKQTGKENEAPVSPLAETGSAASPLVSGSAPSSDPLGPSMAEENRELRERLARAEAKMAKAQAAHKALEAAKAAAEAAQEATIEALARPKGEAGSKKKGFNLQDAMELSEDDLLYQAIMREIHIQVHVSRLDPMVHFSKQDTEKLSNIYRKMRKLFPYLDNHRFPGDWAVADLVKQYLRGLRKKAKRDAAAKKKQAEAAIKKRTQRQAFLQARTVLEEDDPEAIAMEEDNDAGEEEVDENWPPVRPRKVRRLADDE